MSKIQSIYCSFLFFCVVSPLISQSLVDPKASAETQNLYRFFKGNSTKGFLFGHQDDLSYGMGWKYTADSHKSDIKAVCGDYPGIFGWDLGHIELGKKDNLDSVDFDVMRMNIQYAYHLGAVNTISWHPNNPVTGGNAWDHTETVKYILPAGEKHALYKGYLNKVAVFLKSLVDEKGKAIPVVFRPYHEHNGSWFWWGENSCTTEEYVALWKYTVAYMRDSMQVHNLLYAYSANLYQSEQEYLKKYPGDEWVDILGLDIYDLPEYNIDYVKELPKDLKILADLGKKKNKVYALTETGANKLPKRDWWTESLLKNIKGTGIAWVLVWRNANQTQFFGPYPGQGSVPSFLDFYKSPESFFAKDLKKVYKSK